MCCLLLLQYYYLLYLVHACKHKRIDRKKKKYENKWGTIHLPHRHHRHWLSRSVEACSRVELLFCVDLYVFVFITLHCPFLSRVHVPQIHFFFLFQFSFCGSNNNNSNHNIVTYMWKVKYKREWMIHQFTYQLLSQIYWWGSPLLCVT